MADTLVWVAYPVATVVVVLFGVFAFVVGFLHIRRTGKDSQEFFLTARNSAGIFRISWSFYAGVMGSWALFSAPSYAYAAGWLGMLFYSVFSGAPIIIVGYLGVEIQKRIPRVYSFSDYVHRRFGRVVQLYVTGIMLVSMGTALTVEYTTVASLFSLIIGADTAIPIVVIIGVVSSAYTAFGGLHVSLITDQVQAGLSLLLVVILFSWVAAKFRPPGGLGPLPNGLPLDADGYPTTPNLTASNYTGLASICSMPVSLIASSFFSEGPWQRCWSSANHRTLRIGATIGACMIIVVVFLFSLAGFLAAWSGYFVPTGPEDYGNTILFTLLANAKGATTPTIWITTLVACLSVTMSTSAVDNYQNALANNIAGVFFKNVSVWWTRALVLCLNVPCIVISLRNYNVISLFLLTNILNASAAVPVLLGLWRGRLAMRLITPASCLFGCMLGLVSVIVYAVIQAPHWGLSNEEALHSVFLGLYDWPPFVIAPGFSVVGLLLMAGLENAIGCRFLGQHDLDNDMDCQGLPAEAKPTWGVPVENHPSWGGAADHPSSEKGGVMLDPVKPRKLDDEEGVFAKSLEK